jgi:hypothetical protein
MNKTMEYMSYAVPVVTFDLRETRVSAGDAAAYVSYTGDRGTDEERFAAAVDRLLDDPELRVEMAVAGRERAVAELDWAPQRENYVRVFDWVLGVERDPVPPRERRSVDKAVIDQCGHELVDLHDPGALRAFARDRGIPAAEPAWVPDLESVDGTAAVVPADVPIGAVPAHRTTVGGPGRR